MTVVTVRLRSPFAPHQVLAETHATRMRYGFAIGREGRASFPISRADPNLTDLSYLFQLGVMVSLERSDGLLPWVGFVTDRRLGLSDPHAGFVAQDHYGAIFKQARTAKQQDERTLSSGDLIKEILQEVDARGLPPLDVDFNANVTGGPRISYTPKAERLSSFLTKMARMCDCEWGLTYSVAPASASASLTWQHRLGHEHTGVTFEEGRHFEDARLEQRADGHIAAGIAIGSSGTFGARPAVEVNEQGRASPGVEGRRASIAPIASSPALMGTRVIVEPQVSGTDSLALAAERALEAPDGVREDLTFGLVESEIDMKELELGGTYRVRFAGLDLGLGYQRRIRIKAMSLGEDGVVDCVAAVLRATAGEDFVGA